MSTTIEAINSFQKIVKDHSHKNLGDCKTILASVEKIKNATPSVYTREKLTEFLKARAKALSTLVENYFMAHLTAKFPLLDEDIFKLRRHLYIAADNKVLEDHTEAKEVSDTIHMECPLFVVSPLKSAATETQIGKYRRRRTNSRTWESKETVTVTATLPAPPAEIIKESRKALGLYYKVVSEFCLNPLLNDIIDDPPAPTLNVLWIPTVDALSVSRTEEIVVRRGDPALVLTIGKKHYLVTTWDIPEEKPYEHFLREFSVGSTPIPKKKKR